MRRRPAPPALGLVQLLTDRNVAIIIITYIKTQMYYRIFLYKCKHEHYVIFNINLTINIIILLYSRNAFLQMMLTTEMKYVQIMTKSFCIENS